MPRRSSRRNQSPQPGPSNGMYVDSDSESDESVSVSRVSQSMKRINVSQGGKRGKTRGRQVSSDSDEEPEPPRNTQRMNGTQKGQRRTNARQVVSDSDEEPQPSTSQATQKKRRNNASQSQRGHQTLSQASTSRGGDTMMDDDISASQISPNTSLTEQEHNLHVANVVKYILSADQAKKAPIDRSTISKNINCHNKAFREIFKSAQNIIRDVFGYVIVDLENDNKNDAKSQPKQNKAQKFILVNTIESEHVNEDDDEETGTKYILLFLSLTHIFMSGEKCTVGSLRNFLIKLGIVTEHHTRHEQFGIAMDTITNDFVKEKYIHLDVAEDELTWGIRAIKELKPRAVMEFVSKIYDNRELNTWPQEYERLVRIEAEMNPRRNGQMNGTQH